MFPLISTRKHYFSLLLEAQQDNTLEEISPPILNEIDLRSGIRDVGLVIPIETLTLTPISSIPCVHPEKEFHFHLSSNGPNVSFTDLDIPLPGIYQSDGDPLSEKVVNNVIFFRCGFVSPPSRLPIFLNSGGQLIALSRSHY